MQNQSKETKNTISIIILSIINYLSSNGRRVNQEIQ